MNFFLRPVPLAAVGALVFATYLFFLPGSTLPAAYWMEVLKVDKWVHVGIFFLLCWLWGLALQLKAIRHFALLLLAAFVYGCLVEWVQRDFIPNRSFDVYDIVADTAGAVVAIVYLGVYKKNKPL